MKKYLIIFLFIFLSSIFADVIFVHNGLMNITNSTGGDKFNINDTINFVALSIGNTTEIIIENGTVIWFFGDDKIKYGRNVNHSYTFPFIYPVAWGGYYKNVHYPPTETYNWLIVGDVYNTYYWFIPNNSLNTWVVEYYKNYTIANTSVNNSNVVIIKYPTDLDINDLIFKGLKVGGEVGIITDVNEDNIVIEDNITFIPNINKNNIEFIMWNFDNKTSFKFKPSIIYTTPGFHFIQVLIVDKYGKVWVGYKVIYVKQHFGGYVYWVMGPSHYGGEAYTYVYNSSLNHNDNRGNEYVNPHKLTYKVGDKTKFNMKDAWGLYWKWDFGDGVETDYTYREYFTPTEHVYKFPFMWPFFWMSYGGAGSWWKSDTLNFIIVGDVGNIKYNFYPNLSNSKTYKYEYDKKHHTVNLYYYSDIISNPVYNLTIRQGFYYDIPAEVDKPEVTTNKPVKFSFSYPGKVIFVMWCFGDGDISFESSPTHSYTEEGLYYPHVLIVDENGNIGLGIPPPIGVGYYSVPQIYVNPMITSTGKPVNITIVEPKRYTNLRHYIYYGDGNSTIITPGKSPYAWQYTYYKEGVYEVYMYISYNHRRFENSKKVYVINNNPPIASLLILPNPASYKDVIEFNPKNSYDPDANRKIPVYDHNGEIIDNYTIPKTSPMAMIYGYNLLVYNSSGNLVFNYTSNSLDPVYHKFPIGNYTAILTVWDGFGDKNKTEINFSVINKKPVAYFIYYPENPDVGQRIVLDASYSFDPEGKIIKYKWDFGDGSSLETYNPIVYHIYNKPGFYRIKLTVWDELNANNSYERYITVSGILANFTYNPKYPKANENILFIDTSRSYPTNTKIVYRKWDFGDGSVEVNKKEVNHKYNKPGVYIVTLYVKNNINKYGYTSKLIIVGGNESYPPIANFNYIINGLNVTFNASPSYDPDGRIIRYIWNFGDGSSLETYNPIVYHIYNNSGVYTVVLTVIDNSNLSDNCTRYIHLYEENIFSIPVPIYIHIMILILTFYFIRRYYEK
ncbi:PKD domain containing protein [Methanocaldococcus villosus KIN24-T80]|uniref:PKD domain containing protein n=1 Tax=Methanocaldococcus villosus KIN24-T80 TaxID=1069083 RepID=N6UW28_9EURY|nr:PKD domain-containing protein [Methanocaldococcus villosus]ENN96529.1 PKD domain containing protein [Methanocaldococcus villosus KIN24-T80]